jgi:hypothetical protein
MVEASVCSPGAHKEEAGGQRWFIFSALFQRSGTGMAAPLRRASRCCAHQGRYSDRRIRIITLALGGDLGNYLGCLAIITVSYETVRHWVLKFGPLIARKLVVEGFGSIRVEPDGLIEVLNGAVVLAIASIGGAPVAEGGTEGSNPLPSSSESGPNRSLLGLETPVERQQRCG